MQFHQLEYFVAVAETGGFTRGAERAHVVQSAVSAAIRQLESELGGALFERSHHATTLTAEGRALLPHARSMLAQAKRALEAVASAHGDVVGTVTIGTLAYTGGFDVAALLARFHETYPNVAVRLRQTAAGSRTSLEELRSGSLDLALVAPLHGRAPDVTLDPIHAEELVFVCWPGHPLAERDIVTAADIAAETYIDFPSGWGNRDVVDRFFDDGGVHRAINTEVTDFGLALALVRRQLGVTIIPSSSAPDDGTVVKIRLCDEVTWAMYLARSSKRTLSNAAQKLADAITEAVAAPPARLSQPAG